MEKTLKRQKLIKIIQYYWDKNKQEINLRIMSKIIQIKKRSNKLYKFIKLIIYIIKYFHLNNIKDTNKSFKLKAKKRI